MNNTLKKLKNTTKHKIATLTLACGMTSGLVAQTQATDTIPTDSVKTENIVKTPKTDSYVEISYHNMLGVQTTGHEVNFLDRATVGAKAGFVSQKDWYGNAHLAGTVKLHNDQISANLTRATFELGKQLSDKSKLGLKIGREYTENNLVYGNTRLIDYSTEDIYCDYFGNLSDIACVVYNVKNAFTVEAGLIEQADNSFYVVPNAINNPNFWGKVALDITSGKNVRINCSLATELGKEAKDLLANLNISNKKFSILIGGNVNVDNNTWGMCVSANYLTKKDIRCIVSMVKYLQSYIVQAGIEKRNVQLFVSMNTNAYPRPTFNAGLSWVLDGQKKIR
ncbi:MAG: hypothetical protein MJ158_01850 [Alphaproteobacteria bacterium]|nr:hypothetical protein [Alphaproteobacteria bacterium]